MFVTGANLSVPIGTVVLRKGYGLGAQAMAAGSFKAPVFCVAWPTAEFGAMGLEGAVKLGMRRELEAIDDPAERERTYQAMVAAAYDRGSAISMASYFEIDDVIDPADTRRWVRLLFDSGDDGWLVAAAGSAPSQYRRLVIQLSVSAAARQPALDASRTRAARIWTPAT